ncbi:autophagy-related protein 22-like protein [Aspergillus minisclerotigenes]|uniref:Autophagy-related protein n=1 Tax=Aspergillus minisclerotigenes TaxID=656917 RepID=A0A5N6ISB5_9EURO|nr:autophagy-related protein 22-like protein [Aspergillus minisclerotigenes]
MSSIDRIVKGDRDKDNIHAHEQNAGSEEEYASETTINNQQVASLSTKKALWAYLILCFSTGPTSSMAFNYVSAAIQSAANTVGHQPGSDKPCARRGHIKCLVKFGAGEIDYVSYVYVSYRDIFGSTTERTRLYLRSIGRAMEGIVTIMTAGVADYSRYRKTMMLCSILLFGALALPFAGLTKAEYSHLNGLATLYCLLTTVQGVYTVIEASYIPIFMRSVGGLHSASPAADPDTKRTWKKGFTVSVLAMVASNVGGIVALLIGVILSYGIGSYVQVGYFSYLLAITIAGCITIVFGTIGQFLLPSVPGQERPKGQNLLLLAVKGWMRMIGSARHYPEAFKFCIGWILWNTGYSNFLGLTQSLFLEVTGIARGSGVYQVWSFTNVIFACMGSLSFLFLYPHVRVPIKSWAYFFLSVNFLCVLWGCIGISNHVTIGYKHAAEFWVEQVLFMSTSSALRSYNRTVFASLIPCGSEAQFFGMEITLDLATGWINPLVQGVIQDHTHNLRFPMIPNVLLIFVAGLLYIWVDIPKGIEDAKVPLSEAKGGN